MRRRLQAVKCAGPGCRSNGRIAAVGARRGTRIRRASLDVLRLHRGGRNVVLAHVACCSCEWVSPQVPAGPPVVADAVDGHID